MHLHGSGGVVIFDNGFSYVPSVLALAMKRPYAIAYAKKHIYWTDLQEIQEKEVGTVRVLKGIQKIGINWRSCTWLQWKIN